MRRGWVFAAVVAIAGCQTPQSEKDTTGDATGGGAPTTGEDTTGDTATTGEDTTRGDDTTTGDVVTTTGDDATGEETTGDAATGDDAGTTGVAELGWTQDDFDLGEEFVLRSVWGATADRLIAVGNKATIVEYDQGAWTVVHQNTELDTLNGVWGSSADDVWAVGAHGAILHRDATGWNIGQHCANDAACDDEDLCTIDSCGVDGTCLYDTTGAAGCCGTLVMNEGFDDGFLGTWNVQDTSAAKTGVVWNVSDTRSVSPNYSLYFGNPDALNFDGEGNVVSSNVTSGSIQIPTATSATLSFQVFVDTESGNDWDTLEAFVVLNNVPTVVWTKADAGGTTAQQFVSATVDVSAWTGQTVQLRFRFDSVDPLGNDDEGVYIDDVQVSTVCGDAAQGQRFPTLWGVWGSAADNVFSVGNAGTILRFDGQSWKRQSGGEQVDLFAVGANASFLAAGGANADVVSNFAGGLATEKAGSGTIRGLLLADGEAASAIAVGDNGSIQRFADGAWTEEDSGVNWDLSAAYALPDTGETFIVGSGGTALHQKVGETTWTKKSTGGTTTLYDVWGPNEWTVYAVGDKGLLLRYNGNGWVKEGNLASNELRSITGFGNSGPYFTVGGGGAIVEFRDGVWDQIKSPITFVLHGVWGAAEDDVWAVGNLGTILHHDGATWTPWEDVPTDLTLYDVHGRSASEIFAVGAQGAMLQYDGVEWTLLRSSTDANLRGVWGRKADEVYAVGQGGTLMNFNGLNWRQIAIEPVGEADVVDQLLDVWAADAQNIWAVGDAGTIVRSEVDETTGGLIWSKVPQDNPITTRGIWGQVKGEDGPEIWLAGREGYIAKYDGADTQVRETVDSVATLYDILGFKDGRVIAVGNLGTVLRFNAE